MCSCGGNCQGNCVALKGDQGNPGSLWYVAAGVPAPSLGIVNDDYLNTTNGDVYQKTAVSTWTLKGNIKGATGAAGANGASLLYNNWSAVSIVGASGFVDLKTFTLNANVLSVPSDSIEIENGFTYQTFSGFTFPAIKILINGVLMGTPAIVSTFGFQPVQGTPTIGRMTVTIKITMIAPTLMKYRYTVARQDLFSVPSPTVSFDYFTPANIGGVDFTASQIIKSQANGVNVGGFDSGITNNYTRITLFKI